MRLLNITLLIAASCAVACAQMLSTPAGVLPQPNNSGAGQFIFWDETAQNYDAFKSPDALTSGTKEVWVLPSGDGSSGNPCWGWQSSSTAAGITTSVLGWFPCMTLNTNQVVTATKTWTATQQFGAYAQFGSWSGSSFSTSWSLDSSVANELFFRNSSSISRMLLKETGGASGTGTGAQLVAPSIYTTPTAVDTPSAIITGASGQTADIFDVTNVGYATKYLWVDSSGGTHIANCVAGCVSGVTSVSGASPITSTGGATPAIDCSTCLTTAGGQGISGSDSFQSGATFGTSVTLNISPGLAETYPGSTGENWALGDPAHQFYYVDVSSGYLIGSSYVISNASGGEFVGAGGVVTTGGGIFGAGVTMNGGFGTGSATSSTLYIGSGNLYVRYPGASSGISCAGVTNGWFGITSDNYVVWCGNSGTRYRAAGASY